jgi:hypothetical protein
MFSDGDGDEGLYREGGIGKGVEMERKGGRNGEGETEREKRRGRNGEGETEREKRRQRNGDRETETEKRRQRNGDRETETETERENHRERNRGANGKKKRTPQSIYSTKARVLDPQTTMPSS